MRLSREKAPVRRGRAGRALAIAGATCLFTAVLSHALPENYAALGVGFAFMVATYLLVLKTDDNVLIRHFGLSLGGLFETTPLERSRLLGDGLRAAKFCLGAMLLTFPAFWLGFVFWYQPTQAFTPAPLSSLADEAFGQVLVIALPEEAFFRGYLQTALADAWPPKHRVLGAPVGMALIVACAVFALGHVLTDPNPYRLAVFFPALVFGWLREKTGGIGASVGFHAACNVFSSYLARSYGFGA